MKYIKKFENETHKYKVGDWVLLDFPAHLKKKQHINFMENHIGQITQFQNGLYKIDFKHEGFNSDLVDGSIWWVIRDIISECSENREDLEPILKSKKFNM